MKPWNEYSRDVGELDLKLLGSTPYVFHCHHFNLFHDQTVEDAVGPEEGHVIRSRAARDAARTLLAAAAEDAGAKTPLEVLQLAKSLFAWMGHGTLDVHSSPQGGTARGEYLHYSFAWNEKYGEKVRRFSPIDAFAAGFAAAATEVAYALSPGSVEVSEGQCFVCREPGCRFEVKIQSGTAPPKSVHFNQVEKHVRTPGTGLNEEKIQAIAGGLNQFLQGVAGDERGLVQGFGILITRHLSGYYNQTAYDTIHMIEETAPQATEAVEALFGESGHVCVFNTFGNLMLSPEWEGLVGPVQGDVEEIVTSCVAIARGLGFGHWTIEELVPGERLVLRSTSNYEFPFYLERYGTSKKPRCYFFANAARAIMQLAHKVDWASRPQLTESLYQDLFKSDLAWTTEETSCACRGDDVCQVVITKA